MRKYRKLIASLVGVVAIILGPAVLGITPGEEFFGIGQEKVVELVLAALTGLGVWGLRNEEA